MSRTHRPLTVVALLLSAFMGAMEMTVVSTAMPTVISDLGGIEIYAWVFTAYIVASTVSVPLFGKVADLYGRKPVMMVGISLFLLGSCASGLAHSMPALIAARVVQGIGAGATQPVAMTIVGDIFSPTERARMQGLFGAVWGVAGLSGPLLGGVIVRHLSWRWVFYVNLPFGLLAAAVLAMAFHEQVKPHAHRLDLIGAFLLATSVVALLLGWHGSTWMFAVPLSIAAFALFLWVESRAQEPILPLSLFKTRVISVSSAAGALIGGAMMSTMTFIPLFVQGVLGGSPTDAGLAVAPMAIGWPLASTLAGRLLPKVGYRPLVRVGFLLTLASSVVLAVMLKPGASLAVPRWTTVLLGLGLGFANTSLLIAVQTSVSWNQRGVATASTMLFRTLGGALAIGAMGGVLAASLSDHASSDAANKLLGPSHGRDLDPALLHSMSSALAAGLGKVFWMIVGLAGAAFLISLLFPKMQVEVHVPEQALPDARAAQAPRG
jgi:EmrB/QacA subfamily drug resistance transporter